MGKGDDGRGVGGWLKMGSVGAGVATGVAKGEGEGGTKGKGEGDANMDERQRKDMVVKWGKGEQRRGPLIYGADDTKEVTKGGEWMM